MKLSRKLMLGLAVLVVAAAVMAFPNSPANTVEAARGERCEGDEKIEGDGGTFCAPDGYSIEYVCIKAGRDVFTFFPGDTGDGCYVLEWDCHCCVTISGGGTDRDCKAISHIAATYVQGGEC